MCDNVYPCDMHETERKKKPYESILVEWVGGWSTALTGHRFGLVIY